MAREPQRIRRRERKNITAGVAHVNASFNNTMITITDAQGNAYFRGRKPHGDGRERRWVIYQGANDASRVPAEWHGWLHGSFDGVPESNLPPARIWEVDYTPNATGTATAYRPAGALERGGKRAGATGDYEAWSPDA